MGLRNRLRHAQQRSRRRRAFTLIELLVVILIVAILIAVALPSFLGQTSKAQDSVVWQHLTVARTEAKALWTSTYQQAGYPQSSTLVPQLNASEPGYKFVSDAFIGEVGPTGAGTGSDIAQASTTNIATYVPSPGSNMIVFCQTSASGTVFCLKADETAGLYNLSGSTSAAAPAGLSLAPASASAAASYTDVVRSTGATEGAAVCVLNAATPTAAGGTGPSALSQCPSSAEVGWEATSFGAHAAGSGPLPVDQVQPALTGTPYVGASVQGSPGLWSNSPTAYNYEWQLCQDALGLTCQPAGSGSGASISPSYTIPGSASGEYLELTITATNANGTSNPASSQLLGPITGAPANSSAPSITGTDWVGATLTGSPGTWSGSPTSYSYQWQDCATALPSGCTTIAGATSSSYTLQPSDAGQYVALNVTAYNAASTSGVTASSLPTSQILGAPANTAAPVITATSTQAGTTISASRGSWNYTDSNTTYAYQWQDCPTSGGSCTNIPGATGSSYALTGTDINHTVDVIVTATNQVGPTSATSTPTATVYLEPSANLVANYKLQQTTYDQGIADATGNQPSGGYSRNAFEVPSSATDSLGYTHLRGLAATSSPSNTQYLGSIPASQAPAAYEIYPVAVAGGVDRLEVQSNGELYLDSAYGCAGTCSGNPSWVSLANINFPSASVSQTALQLSAPWTNWNGGWGPATYSVDANGMVHLQGLVDPTSAVSTGWPGSIIGTLPAADTPSAEVLESGLCNYSSTSDVVCRIDIDTDGTVRLVSDGAPAMNTGAAGVWVSLAGISFPDKSNTLSWHDATLGSGWQAYSNGYFTPSYAETSDGIVYTRGLTQATQSGAAANFFQVPDAYQPGADNVLLGGAAGINGSADVVPRFDTGDLENTGSTTLDYLSSQLGGAYGTTSGGWMGVDGLSWAAMNNKLNWTTISYQNGFGPYSAPSGGLTLDTADENGNAGAVGFGGGTVADLGNPTGLQLNQGTMSVWVNTTDASSNNDQGVMVKQNAYGIFLYGGDAIAYNWGAGQPLNSGVDVADGKWHQLTLTWDSAAGQECLYVDGSHQTCASFSIANQSVEMMLAGGGPQMNSQTLSPGTIAHPQVYNSVMSAQQVSWLYNDIR